MVDFGQPGQHFLQHRGRQRKRVAARKNDVVDLGMVGNILKGPAKIAQGLLGRMPHYAAAEAVAAVHGATLCGYQQGGAFILVQHAVALVVLVVAVGVGSGRAHGTGHHQFFGIGKTHAADGVGWIVFINKAQIIAGNIDWMYLCHFAQDSFVLRSEGSVFLQLVDTDNIVGKFLFPIKAFPARFCVHCSGPGLRLDLGCTAIGRDRAAGNLGR